MFVSALFEENCPRILRCEHAAVVRHFTSKALELQDLALISSLKDATEAVSKKRRKAGETSFIIFSIRLLGDSAEPWKRTLRRPGMKRRSGLRTAAASFAYTADRPFNPVRFEEWVEAVVKFSWRYSEAGGPPKSICRAKGLLWMLEP